MRRAPTEERGGETGIERSEARDRLWGGGAVRSKLLGGGGWKAYGADFCAFHKICVRAAMASDEYPLCTHQRSTLTLRLPRAYSLSSRTRQRQPEPAFGLQVSNPSSHLQDRLWQRQDDARSRAQPRRGGPAGFRAQPRQGGCTLSKHVETLPSCRTEGASTGIAARWALTCA